MRAPWLLVPLALVSFGCSSSKDDSPTAAGRSTTTTSTSTSTTSTTVVSTTTIPFAGSTNNASAPASTDHTALLTKLTVEHQPGVDRVTFEFGGAGQPGVAAGYETRPTADGSGAPVKVDGSAYLQVRLTPAATFDLTGEVPKASYTGGDRVRGAGTTGVTEVVRSGDFEANLTWVVGLRSKAAFRLSTLSNPSRVVLEIAAPGV
ncbi:MAG: uncharacterized protein JWN29_1661 [Acidimicrobiales bacterium]|nr:uncharacterized protein [Acidimicrobiales bacterium]